MVEQQSPDLNLVFHALADGTRRDILRRVAGGDLSVGEIASAYPMSFAAVSKHLGVLEKARLVTKRREGRQQVAALSPAALSEAARPLELYRGIWESRLDRLERYLKEDGR